MRLPISCETLVLLGRPGDEDVMITPSRPRGYNMVTSSVRTTVPSSDPYTDDSSVVHIRTTQPSSVYGRRNGRPYGRQYFPSLFMVRVEIPASRCRRREIRPHSTRSRFVLFLYRHRRVRIKMFLTPLGGKVLPWRSSSPGPSEKH